MKLRLKFFYKEDGKTRFIISYAAPYLNLYRTATHLLTEDGKFELKRIVGQVEETLEDASEIQ